MTGKNLIYAVLKLNQEVALVRDVPDENLKAGDVAVLVDYVPHSRGGEAGAVLEILARFNLFHSSLTIHRGVSTPRCGLWAQNPHVGVLDSAEIVKLHAPVNEPCRDFQCRRRVGRRGDSARVRHCTAARRSGASRKGAPAAGLSLFAPSEDSSSPMYARFASKEEPRS
jgi:hypothetical protein